MTISIPKYEDITVLVVGDLMLDRYWSGGTHRISPEAPVPVVHVKSHEDRAGGAGNVALNLRGLGCRVILMGLIGQDPVGDALEHCLVKDGVECHLLRVADKPTITKLRVLGRNQQLIRLDFEDDFHSVAKDNMVAQFAQQLAHADVVIFSDYGKGITTIIHQMVMLAKAAGIKTFVDPKNRDFNYYHSSSVITPNLKEFEEVVGVCHSEEELVGRAQELVQQCALEALLVTRGEDGMTLVSQANPPVHLKAHASEVYDVSGAGDTVISVLAASIAAGETFANSAILANIAAGIVVRKLGVTPISVPELRRSVQRYHGCDLGILQEHDLIIAVADARAHGETVVMTNGCFDILHAGHIAYLEEAKSLGDRLIVAVNDDASVARLKGSDRPLNTLTSRMKLLSALRCVDWVVSFSEATPERLITEILPDILVKGGDYQIPQIAGAKQVLANGGDVKILSFVDGYSTTSIIQRIKGEAECMS